MLTGREFTERGCKMARVTREDVDKVLRRKCEELALLKDTPQDCEKAAELAGWIDGYLCGCGGVGLVTAADWIRHTGNKERASNGMGAIAEYHALHG